MPASLPDSPDVPRVVQVIPDDPDLAPLPIVEDGGRAWAVVWPGVGAHLRSMHRISLIPTGSTVPMRHPMEATYYVLAGTVEVDDLESRTRHVLVAGSMALIDPGTSYRMIAGPGGCEVVGGPCPPDPGLYMTPART
jgi:quercetin dioxygenase-like cupin family protein